MANSKKALNEKLRSDYLSLVAKFLDEQGEEVLRTASNEICLPCVDAEGNGEYVVITFKVPTGSRDGVPYDGHNEAESYKLETKAKAEERERKAKEKAEKVAKDKAMREAKAKAKAEREAKGE